VSHLAKALPELISAAVLAALWIEPQRFEVSWFRAAVFALLLEFFAIHAGGFMAITVTDPEATRRQRTLRLVGWTAGYLAFVSLFALGFEAWWMVLAFAWFCFSKLQAIWMGGEITERDRSHAIVSWALSVAVFLGSVFATAALDVPAFGAGPAMRDAAGFDGNSTGLWEAEPHRAIAGAVLYFTIMGLSRPILARGFAIRPGPKASLS
jgi:hypothetical protein